MGKSYRLSADCIPVRGYQRCTVHDLSRQDVRCVSEFVYNTLINNDIINEQMLPASDLRELIEHEIIFECPQDAVALFPRVQLGYCSPFKIESCIVEIDNDIDFDCEQLIAEISTVGCKQLQIWAYDTVGGDIITSVLEHVAGKNILNTDLILKFDSIDVHGIISSFPFISSIVAYGAENMQVEEVAGCTIIHTPEPFAGCQQCGNVAPNQFVCNREFFFLSASQNTCLYRKLSIDCEGYIRNCPASPQHFGRVGEVSLAEAMVHPDFSRLWGITKDQVDVCRDCEFRRICPDCRVFTRQPERHTAHPARCTYNPYIARWEGQEGYVRLDECGAFTDKGYFVDTDFVNSL